MVCLQGHINLLCNLVDFKMDPQSAIDAPRFCSASLPLPAAPRRIGRTNLLVARLQPARCASVLDGTAQGAVSLETGLAPEVIERLKAMGHKVVGPVTGAGPSAGGMEFTFGRAQLIVRDPGSGVLCAGSDGRADGCAMGW